jgi:hypothetical protein
MAIKRRPRLPKQGEGGQAHESERPPLEAEIASHIALEQKKKQKQIRVRSRGRYRKIAVT